MSIILNLQIRKQKFRRLNKWAKVIESPCSPWSGKGCWWPSCARSLCLCPCSFLGWNVFPSHANPVNLSRLFNISLHPPNNPGRTAHTLHTPSKRLSLFLRPFRALASLQGRRLPSRPWAGALPVLMSQHKQSFWKHLWISFALHLSSPWHETTRKWHHAKQGPHERVLKSKPNGFSVLPRGVFQMSFSITSFSSREFGSLFLSYCFSNLCELTWVGWMGWKETESLPDSEKFRNFFDR